MWRDTFSTVGDTSSTCGGIASVLWGDTFSTVEVVQYSWRLFSTVEVVQYREQENVFLFEFGLIVPAVLKCLFQHNLCRRSLPTWRKVVPIYSFVLQSKILFMYIM